MKKLLEILVLGLLTFNTNNVIAVEKVSAFSCGTIDGPSEGITLSIDLDKSTMEFGLPKYKITSISDDVIIALSPSKNNGKNFKKTLTFHRITTKLTLIHYTKPQFVWNLKCKEIIKGTLSEKTFKDLGFGLDGLLAQLVERTTLNR